MRSMWRVFTASVVNVAVVFRSAKLSDGRRKGEEVARARAARALAAGSSAIR